jgi:putative MATE family efflux protein
MNKTLDKKVIIRFTYPVVTENIVSITLSLIVSMLIGGISGSALAVIGISNTAFTLGISAFAVFTNTPAILTARLIGANENAQASEIIEQSVFFSAAFGLATAAVIEIFSAGIVNLLTPNASAELIAETLSFFRIFSLSFPTMLLYQVLCGIMRSSGNSIMPMTAGIIMNLLHLIFTWLFAYLFRLGITGVAISYVTARFIGMLIILFAVLRSDYNFQVDVKKIFRPKLSVLRRIFRLGLPISIESTLVQGGYLATNVMAVGLGIQSASAYQIANTVNTFISLPQGVSNVVSLVTGGQLIGAGENKKARKTAWVILLAALAAMLIIGLPIAAGGTFISSLYSSDAAVIAESASLMPLLILVAVPACFINVFDPVLRAGGDPKFVMTTGILGVWLVRIPVTYLLCYRLGLGTAGIFLGNFTGLSVRSISNLIRFLSGRWLRKEI